MYVTYSLAVLCQGWPCSLEFIFPSLELQHPFILHGTRGRSSWGGSWEGNRSGEFRMFKGCPGLAGCTLATPTLKGWCHDPFGARPAPNSFCIMETTWKSWCFSSKSSLETMLWLFRPRRWYLVTQPLGQGQEKTPMKLSCGNSFIKANPYHEMQLQKFNY